MPFTSESIHKAATPAYSASSPFFTIHYSLFTPLPPQISTASPSTLSPTMNPTPGVLEVITGPMFSGKSEELIRRLKRASIALTRVARYKPSIILRYHRAACASHSSQTHEAVPIASVEELRAILYPQLDDIEV